jgi:tetratricopeptide (TPR) repeat protein
MTALAHASLREKALACVSRWLEADAPPPRGWLALAALLERVASSSLAERALERAVAAAERGAHAALADRLERAAWAAYDRGDLELAERLATRAVALEG